MASPRGKPGSSAGAVTVLRKWTQIPRPTTMGSSPVLLHPLLPDDHEKEAELGKSPTAELQTEARQKTNRMV